MTQNNSKGKTIGFYDSNGVLANMVQKQAERRGIPVSKFLKDVLIDHLKEYEKSELSEAQMKWLRVKKKERKEKLYKDIAKDKKKDNTYLEFVKEQLYHQKMAGCSDKEIREWLDTQKEIFEIRGYSQEKLEYYKDNHEQITKEYAEKHKRAGKNDN